MHINTIETYIVHVHQDDIRFAVTWRVTHSQTEKQVKDSFHFEKHFSATTRTIQENSCYYSFSFLLLFMLKKRSSLHYAVFLNVIFWVGAIMPTPAIPTPTILTQFLPANNPDDNNPDFNIDSNNIEM